MTTRESARKAPDEWARLAADWQAAWVFAIWNRRGTWRPLAATTEMFLEPARLRLARQLRARRFALVLVAFQLLIVAMWNHWATATGPGGLPLPRTLLLLPAAIIVWTIAALLWTRHEAVRALAQLDRLAEELRRGDEVP